MKVKAVCPEHGDVFLIVAPVPGHSNCPECYIRDLESANMKLRQAFQRLLDGIEGLIGDL